MLKSIDFNRQIDLSIKVIYEIFQAFESTQPNKMNEQKNIKRMQEWKMINR